MRLTNIDAAVTRQRANINLKLCTREIIRNRLVKYYEPLHTEQIILSMMYPGSFRMKRNMLPSITNMLVSL